MNATLALDRAGDYGRDSAELLRDNVARATSCLDLNKVPPNALRETERTVALLLMEVFDRINLPEYEQIAGPAQVGRDQLAEWTIPETEISIARVEEGLRAGEYLFSPDTVARVGEFYDRVKHLSNKEGPCSRALTSSTC